MHAFTYIFQNGSKNPYSLVEYKPKLDSVYLEISL